MTEAPHNGIKGWGKRRGVEFLRTATNILNKTDFVYSRRGDDLARGYRLCGRARRNPAPYSSHELIDFRVCHYGVDLEERNGAMLAFRVRSGAGAREHAALLFVLAEIFNASCLASQRLRISAGQYLLNSQDGVRVC